MKKSNILPSLAALVVLALCAYAGYCMNRPPLTTEQKWERFERRTRNCGDLGCEIEYQRIFGHPSEGYYFSGR